MGSSPGELPPELHVRPFAFIAVTGLDTLHNAIHKAVWNSFSTNRHPDRLPIVFKVLDGDHEYPKVKTTRTSYEFCMPKGIIKTNWMRKHLYEIPSLVVVFYDLDWDDPMWSEKQMECSTKVEVVRTALESRNTKLAVVLIQRNAPLPSGEEDIAAKRAAALCASCELSAKSLFVLPQTDHLLGYIVRLENAFYELSQSYYHQEIRKIKSHQDNLNKMNHQPLYVRHQFKVGFLNELKQDNVMALKHYKQAYTYLMEIRAHDMNLMEVKTVAGFINYKICRLSFQLNTPLDSISQFRKHVNIFKSKIGLRELAFEHSSWMSKQFSIFGDLFDEAIKLGLTAIQTQHPGFYYQQAANHAITQKLLCQELCRNVKEQGYRTNDSLGGTDSVEYYGQRPWRSFFLQGVELSDVESEKEGIQAIQWKEATEVDHSRNIIPLLSSAVTQFKTYKGPRMKRYLLVQMGEEYYHTKEYDRALTLLMHVMWDYRWERWWRLLVSIQRMALRCAYIIANIQEYVTLTLEVLSRWINFSPEEKERMQRNLNKIISGGIPSAEPGCHQECLDQASERWQALMARPKPIAFTIEMNNIISCVDCQAWFRESTFQADHPVIVEVCVRACSPFPIRFSKLNVLFNNQFYNQHCILLDRKECCENVALSRCREFSVEPGRPQFYLFSFIPQPEDLHKVIEITGLVLHLGEEDKCCAMLHWTIGGDEAFQQLNWSPWRNLSYWQPKDDTLPVQTTTRILPRESCVKLNVYHESPALVNECYALQLKITNSESVAVTNLILSVGLKEDPDQTSSQSTCLSLEKPKFDDAFENKTELSLDQLPAGSETIKCLFMKAFQAGTRNLFVKLSFRVEVTVNAMPLSCFCTEEEEIIVPTVKPFKITVKQLNMRFEPLSELRVHEPFILLMEIECICPWAVNIDTSTIGLNPNIKSIDEHPVSQMEKVELQSHGKAVECICVVASKLSSDLLVLGSYTLTWRRRSSDFHLPLNNSTVALPSSTISPPFIYMEADLPAHGWTRSPLCISYILHNYTSSVQEFELTIDSSDAFMFAGQKQLYFRLMPAACRRLVYNLYPLIAGYVALPHMHLTLTHNSSLQSSVDSLLKTVLPTHIFIMPKGKQMTAPKIFEVPN